MAAGGRRSQPLDGSACQHWLRLFSFALLPCCASCALPSWPPQSRYILNPERGVSIPTALCAGQFNTPCAIEKVHQIVYDVAEAFAAANDTAEFIALVSSVNDKAYNQPVAFWPTVLNSTGHVLATGVNGSQSYSGPAYVGGWYQDILIHEGRQDSDDPDVGGVLQYGVWERIKAAADEDGYFFTHGWDGHHEREGAIATKTVDRVNYVLRVATVGGDVYVTSAYSAMPLRDRHSQSNCTAAKDALCSLTNVRTILGNVVTDLIHARDQAEVDSIFAAISNKHYNRFCAPCLASASRGL